MTTSTADNADAADPGVEDGTVEAESASANGDPRGCGAAPLTLSQTDVSVDLRQGKVGFLRHRRGESSDTRHGEEGGRRGEARREGWLYKYHWPSGLSASRGMLCLKGGLHLLPPSRLVIEQEAIRPSKSLDPFLLDALGSS